MENSQSRASRIDRRGIRWIVGLATLCVMGVGVSWWVIAGDNPTVTIPNPILPQPNAFDFYVAAGKALVHGKQSDDPLFGYGKPKVPLTEAQIEAIVQQNAPALQRLYQGFNYEYCNPPSRSFFAKLPERGSFRGLARLLVLQSHIQATHGKWKDAADSALDTIRMGEEMPRGGGILLKISGVECEETGQKSLWELVEHLDAAQSRASLRRLQTMMDRHFTFADTLQEEKWLTQASLMDWFQKTSVRAYIAQARSYDGDDAPSDQEIYSTALCLLCSKKRCMEGYTHLMEINIGRARQPYISRSPLPPGPSDILSQQIRPEYDQVWFRALNTETQNGLLLVALALHAYRLENGHYPTSLAELVPLYLQKLPDDPFALRGSFGYRNEGRKFVLYSIGPDGKDDSGKPIDNPKYTDSHYRLQVQSESQGDIVAGFNFRLFRCFRKPPLWRTRVPILIMRRSRNAGSVAI